MQLKSALAGKCKGKLLCRCITQTKTARRGRAVSRCRNLASLARARHTFGLLAELGDLMREPRDLAARGVLVNDVALGCAHQLGLCARHGLDRGIAVAAIDRVLDAADSATHLRAARLVDRSAAGNLARRFLGGSGVGHRLKYP